MTTKNHVFHHSLRGGYEIQTVGPLEILLDTDSTFSFFAVSFSWLSVYSNIKLMKFPKTIPPIAKNNNKNSMFMSL